jgi:hypothetical protein
VLLDYSSSRTLGIFHCKLTDGEEPSRLKSYQPCPRGRSLPHEAKCSATMREAADSHSTSPRVLTARRGRYLRGLLILDVSLDIPVSRMSWLFRSVKMAAQFTIGQPARRTGLNRKPCAITKVSGLLPAAPGTESG